MLEDQVGIGFRRDFGDSFLEQKDLNPGFIEVAPENWIKLGGYWKKVFDRVTEKYPLVCHGLSLSIGSPDPLDYSFLRELKAFLDDYNVTLYSEHLSYSKSQNAHLYDLLPIPFREDAVRHIVSRIKEVQDFLERPLVIENVSYYTPVAAEMKEEEFISAIVRLSGCKLLLDVNNVYVNAFNHSYHTKDFVSALPLDSVAYVHMAGHTQFSDDCIIDTHGEDIIDPVFDLFEWTLEQIKPVPVLLERDFNIPELKTLNKEVEQLRSIISKVREKSVHHA